MTSYHIEGPWKGKLAIIPRPRGDDWLPDELRTLKEEGFEVLVSLLTEPESKELGLDQEADALTTPETQLQKEWVLELAREIAEPLVRR